MERFSYMYTVCKQSIISMSNDFEIFCEIKRNFIDTLYDIPIYNEQSLELKNADSVQNIQRYLASSLVPSPYHIIS